MVKKIKRGVVALPFSSLDEVEESIILAAIRSGTDEKLCSIYTNESVVSITAIEGRINITVVRDIPDESGHIEITGFNIGTSKTHEFFALLRDYEDGDPNVVDQTLCDFVAALHVE